MKKLIGIVFLAIVFAVTSGNLFAQDSNAYKNNLLKIELNKISEDSYDIGLYTQKTYNEPVKVVKKSNNYYYLLLPETSHAVTSTPTTGAIKNVSVKSYPYAGQDVDNGYTKIGISTSKPVNLSTSLITVDSTVSPRLDPIRLARLDKAFERYSQRLADNNIPTPLAQFKKTTASSPDMESQISIKSEQDLIALSKPVKQEGVKKPAPVKTAVKQTKKAKPQAATKAPVKVAQTAPKAAVEPVKTVKKQSATAKKIEEISKKEQQAASKPAPQAKPAKQVQPQKAVQPKKQTVAAVKPAGQPVKSQQASKPAQPAPVQEKVAQVPASSTPVSAPVQTAQKSEAERALEYEKQLQSKEPVQASFKDAPSQKEEPASLQDVKPETPVSMPEQKVVPIQPQPQPAPQQQNTMLGLAMAFAGLLLLYIYTKTANAKKLAHNQAVQRMQSESQANIKELLKKSKPEAKDVQPALQEQEASDVQPAFNQVVSDGMQEQTPALAVDSRAAIYDEGTIDAYGNYEDAPEIAENAVYEHQEETSSIRPEIAAMIEKMAVASSSDITYDDEADEALKQLYTPIEDVSGYAVYNEADYSKVQEVESVNNIAAEDVAQIVASSKLTETRGLYLAKFEGSTSLVGYIQDDVYVLYNFGDTEISDIDSKLAQESDTDSLYIVSTGGKKLMVKSTPYDMSLEMVM